MSRTDEEVFKILVKEKQHRQATVIAVLAFFLIVFVVATIVLSVLYFTEGTLVEETEIKIITDGGHIQNSNIDSYQSATNGDVTITEANTTLIVCIVFGSIVLIVGFICLLSYIKKQKS